jgi:hypothetical protein
MATQVQLRRGTTVQHSTFTGAVGEVTFDTDKNTLIVHDGSTAGGYELAVVGNDITVDDLIVSGNLTVNGTTTTVNSATLSVADNIITLNSDVTGTPSQDAGIEVERGTSTNAVIQWDETNDYWEIASGGTTGRILTTGDSSSFATSAQGSTADSAMQDLVDDTTPQLGGDLASNGNDILFADNDKAIFGGSTSELQIYSDGSNSYIKDNGTGRLAIQSSSDFLISNTANTQNYLYAQESGYVRLYYSGATKLATTSTGVDVTGTITADGLTVNGSLGNLLLQASGAEVHFSRNGNNDILANGGSSADLTLGANDALLFKTGSSLTERIRIDSSGRVGIGTGSPATNLHVSGDSGVSAGGSTPIAIRIGATDQDAGANTWNTSSDFTQLQFYSEDGSGAGAGVRCTIGAVMETTFGSQTALTFRSSGGTERMRINSGGNVGIGTDNPSHPLDISKPSTGTVARFTGSTDSGRGLSFSSSDNGIYLGAEWDRNIASAGGIHTWSIGGSEAMRIDSSGNLHVACESHQASASSGTGGYTLGTLGVSARNGDVTHYFNRIGTDGRIVEFRKNGTLMGGIGSDETQPDGTENTTTATLYIGAGDTGLGFTDDGDFIYPYDFDSSTPSNNVITLGHSSKKFKDGHFAGTLYAARGVGETRTQNSASGGQTEDFSNYQNFRYNMVGNITLNNPSNHIEGQSGFIIFKQDATGGRTVSLGSYFKTAGGAGLTLSTGANAIDMVPYVVISSTEILLGTPQLAFA